MNVKKSFCVLKKLLNEVKGTMNKETELQKDLKQIRVDTDNTKDKKKLRMREPIQLGNK